MHMIGTPWSIHALRRALSTAALTPSKLAVAALDHMNGNSGRNTYLWSSEAWTCAEAARAEQMQRGASGPFADGRSALWGLPVSVKDCFDLGGASTTCGVGFYQELYGVAKRDSWLIENLRAAGAVVTGKTHLHPLAYGITGENPEFGDCVQPGDPTALTGGSSSGAVASILEGSAVAAIGTDTGGSVRVPAALCGLAGYRATLGRGDWRGGAHLAESFDTMGWLFRDLSDAPLLAFPFAPNNMGPAAAITRFAVIDGTFLHDCEPLIVASLAANVQELRDLGLHGTTFDASWWAEAFDIFAAIQAWEAARTHAKHLDRIEPAIRQRLEWGASISAWKLDILRHRHAAFRARMDELFAEHQLLVLPAAPVARLAVGADHTQTRARLLRYTTPFSLAGNPAVAVPCAVGGMQWGAAPGSDEPLLELAARLATQRKSTDSLRSA